MRKRRILTVLLALTVIFTMSFAAIPVYAVSGTAITSADDLKAMLVDLQEMRVFLTIV